MPSWDPGSPTHRHSPIATPDKNAHTAGGKPPSDFTETFCQNAV